MVILPGDLGEVPTLEISPGVIPRAGFCQLYTDILDCENLSSILPSILYSISSLNNKMELLYGGEGLCIALNPLTTRLTDITGCGRKEGQQLRSDEG